MSEPQALWTAAFTKAQKAMPEIAKGKTAQIRTKGGASYSYSYADLPEIIKSVRPVLAEHGLGFSQSVEASDRGVAVTTRIYHEGGHTEFFGPIVLPAGSDAQSAGSAITYARRYSLCAALGIAADEDDDAQAAVQKKDTNWSAGSVTPDPTASPPTPLEAGEQDAAPSTTASTGAEVPISTPSDSAPVAAEPTYSEQRAEIDRYAYLRDLIDQAKNGLITWRDVAPFVSAPALEAGMKQTPGNFGQLNKAPVSVLENVVQKLNLEERVGANA